MSTNHGRRLDDIAKQVKPPCRTCYGHAYAVVFVPQGDDETAPEWNPTHCRECGIPLRHVRQIIGISEADMFGTETSASEP